MHFWSQLFFILQKQTWPIYEEKANGVKISKSEWYEFGEKSLKFFLNLEKQHTLLNQVQTLSAVKKVTDKNKINQELECFYKKFEKSKFQKEDINAYLRQINIPILTEEQSQTCEGPITESKLLNTLESMLNNKSPGKDGPTKEFYETFWEEIKIPMCDSITKSYQNGELSTSQNQAVIKHIKKRIRTRNYLKTGDLLLY